MFTETLRVSPLRFQDDEETLGGGYGADDAATEDVEEGGAVTDTDSDDELGGDFGLGDTGEEDGLPEVK